MSDAFARAATFEDLKNLLRSLNEHGVDYLLIGAYALQAHGYQRATTDIDILVRPGRDQGERVKAALLILPDGSAKDLDPAWLESGDNIRVVDAFVVDLMLAAGGETYDSLQPFATTVDVDGVPARTLNLEGLLRTKQTAREKDKMDRAVLERAISELRKDR